MAATVKTKENFPSSATEADMKEEQRLRLKAGAITCTYSKTGSGWTLVTEWNVIGEQ